jgi:ABC-2 type transport system ATP-binding protein
MDLCEEFTIAQDQKAEIFELRKNYLGTEVSPADFFSSQTEEKVRKITASINSLELKNPNNDKSLPLLTAEKISKQFTRGRTPFYLQSLDVELLCGQITGVVGENGNGKTTLLRILAGQISSDTGRISFPALTPGDGSWYSAKNKMAFIPQRIEKWHGTLLDNLRFYATIHGFTEEANAERIDYILFRLGLDKFRDLKWTEISSGYRLRFELAKMLLWKPKLLILDEPLANLDINAQQLFLQDLRFFTLSESHPMGIILSSQNLHEIEKIADNLIFIRQGKTIYNGPQTSFASGRDKNSFEVSGKFDLESLAACFNGLQEVSVENAGTSFIINAQTDIGIYRVTELMKKSNLELIFIRDISQSTRKLFHKDI